MNEIGFAAEPSLSRQTGVLLPYLIVGGGGLLAMVLDSTVRSVGTGRLYALTVAVLVAAGTAQLFPAVTSDAPTLLGGMLCHDSYAHFFNYLFLGIALLTVTFAASPNGAGESC